MEFWPMFVLSLAFCASLLLLSWMFLRSVRGVLSTLLTAVTSLTELNRQSIDLLASRDPEEYARYHWASSSTSTPPKSDPETGAPYYYTGDRAQAEDQRVGKETTLNDDELNIVHGEFGM